MAQKQFKYDLTIGMIVKNEIKYLRRCLETLAPLRDAISCELIITDTGSTDGTKEIAKEFADVYLEFEWCNDFAKARNTAVEIAQGRWFFYVDADNHFDESLLEIVSFLKMPKVDETYDHANITIRNYSDTEENLSAYSDASRPWLVNFSQGRRRFHYSIHETIFVDGEKSGAVPTIMHHWGYLKNVVQGKKERNEPLLRALVKKSPKDLKARHQLLASLSDPKEKKAFFEESMKIGLPRAQTIEECQIWVMLFQQHYFWYLLQNQQWEALEKLLPTWRDYIPNSIFSLEFLGLCLEYRLRHHTEQDQILQEEFSQYQTLFEKIQANPQEKYLVFSQFPCASLSHYAKMEVAMLQRSLFANQRNWGKEWLPQAKGYTYQSPEGKHPYTMTYCNFAFLLEDYAFLTTLVNLIHEKGQANEANLLEEAIISKFHSVSPQEQQDFLAQFHPKKDFLPKQTPVEETSSLPEVSTLKETLLSLLMAQRLEEAKSLFLLIEQAYPQDEGLATLKPLLSPSDDAQNP